MEETNGGVLRDIVKRVDEENLVYKRLRCLISCSLLILVSFLIYVELYKWSVRLPDIFHSVEKKYQQAVYDSELLKCDNPAAQRPRGVDRSSFCDDIQQLLSKPVAYSKVAAFIRSEFTDHAPAWFVACYDRPWCVAGALVWIADRLPSEFIIPAIGIVFTMFATFVGWLLGFPIRPCPSRPKLKEL